MLVLSTVHRDYPRFSNGFDNNNLPHEQSLRRLEDGIDSGLELHLPLSSLFRRNNPMKILVMKERGTAAVNVAKNCDGVVCLVQWKGNKTYLVAGNKFGVRPKVQATKYKSSKMNRVVIDCPNSIKLYNLGMAG